MRGERMKNFRWLHLSDFHTGKDNYGQIKLFDYILKHMKDCKSNGFIPDAVFITGDIADKGLGEQYSTFSEDFLLHLLEIYDDMPNVYIVPGNHDLERDKCTLAAKSLYSISDEKQSRFFDADAQGLAYRKQIFDRFLNFHQAFASNLCFSVNGIFEKEGYFTDKISKENKMIGIVGVNTAWLSNSNEDKEKITPGKYLLEEALNSVSDCDYKFVLGHHPLSWLQYGQRQQISTLLAQKKAIYLHGHMHTNSGEYALASSTGVLTLQGGAAFQTREDEIYYNSLQWGELNFDNDVVKIIPKKWTASEQKFKPDFSDRLPEAFRVEGTDFWELPYTYSISDKKSEKVAPTQKKIPAGWQLIDKKFVEKRVLPSDEDVLKYFDGREPTYNEIFSSYIPTREIVYDLKNKFVVSNEDNKIKCVLITGAGGEGKTTVFLQVIKILVEEHKWNALVLRQVDKDFQLYENQILDVMEEGNWIVCVDNCFPIAEKLFVLLKKASKREHQHIHFMLCSRDVDWKNSESSRLQWGNFSNFSVHKLRGINEKDAEKIVKAWSALGEKGLGKLKSLTMVEAKEQLILSSKNEEKENGPEEGALLGAMLSTRYGNELYSHVRDMLLRLQEIPIYHETLLNAFAYIVAMHSEKLYFLSKTVMAHVYNCELKNVKKSILGPLGDEAASAVSGELIYTRHMSIAKLAREILSEEFHIDFDEIFIELAAVAVEAQKKGEYIEAYASWKFMSDNFKKTNRALAIGIDKKILDVDPYDPFMIVHLSKLYRDAEQSEMAINLFRNVSYVVDHRPFFCEWALVEANIDNKAVSVCLSALALSDQISRKAIDVINACINLYSIAKTFDSLYSLYKNEKYLQAARAAVVIGVKIDRNDAQIKQLKNSLFINFETETFNENQSMQCFLKGILTAAVIKEIDFQDWIPKIENLEYKKLFSLAGITV